MKTLSLSIAVELHLSLKLFNFSFVSKLLCFVYNQAWPYKRWQGGMKVPQMLNSDFCFPKWRYAIYFNHFLIASSIFWAKLIMLGFIFSLVISQRDICLIYWKEGCFSRDLHSLSETFFFSLILIQTAISFSFKLEFLLKVFFFESLLKSLYNFEKSFAFIITFKIIKIDWELAQILQDRFWWLLWI